MRKKFDLGYKKHQISSKQAHESSKSIIYMLDGLTKPATKFWICNNGTGTWRGYPKP